jgi:excisionase family DNA binding protein
VTSEPTPLFTPAQVAQLAQVSTKTVYRAIRSRALVAVVIGNRYRVRPEDYQSWIGALALAPTGSPERVFNRRAAVSPRGSLEALREIEEAAA